MNKQKWFDYSGNLAIYGAQIYATSIYKALVECNSNVHVLCFLVSCKEGNPDNIDGIPVYEADNMPENIVGKNLTVWIATPEFYHDEIIKNLNKKRCAEILPITSDMQEELLRSFYSLISKKEGWDFQSVRDFSDSLSETRLKNKKEVLRVYQACSFYDKPLKYPAKKTEYMLQVQAGSALAPYKEGCLKDSEGEYNISERNQNYCELSVAYWMLKNHLYDSRYVGLCHYRRYLDVTPELIAHIEKTGAAGVLPYPMQVYPDAFSHHRRFVKEKDWERMEQVLLEKYPDYYAAGQDIWKGTEFYLHNIWILESYEAEQFLEWMFGILFEIERRWECNEEPRQDRHMGYLGESLTTLYFLYHRKDLKLVHGKEVILS